MSKVKKRVLQMNFQKLFKRFLLISLAVVILGGVLVGVSFRTQISEGISYVQQSEQEEDRFEADAERQTDRPEDGYFEQGDHRDHREHDFFEHIPITKPSFGAKIILCAFVCLCCLIFVAYWLIIAAWLYQAAVLAGMNGFLWLLAGACGNLFAVILFILVRNVIRKKCSACGQWQQVKAKYCAHCGTQLYEKCPACGEMCANSDQYCSACGNRLHDAES
uniref:zinc ribbon domain-containing protein n=1 Tax=Enterocloster clostridioformis TaxID=1531 RepID=UPI001C3CEFEC|nr:zinc ribbon domain-containing protein [Enterocloster clostridioformis]